MTTNDPSVNENQSHVVIITGASRGIGLAVAERLCQHHYRVINISRSPCPLPQVDSWAVDFIDSHWENLVQEKFADGYLNGKNKKFQNLSIIHNASYLQKDSIYSNSVNDLTKVLAVNVVAPQGLNKIFLPYMHEGAAIIYVGSTLSEKAVGGAFSYVVSKHAILGMMRATCQDLVGKGIHTCCVAPGFTDTEMLRTHLRHDESVLSAVKEKVAFKRLITPEEIAETIFFCLQHPVINGSLIHANLGQLES